MFDEKEHAEKAAAILAQLNGMKIADAQEILDKCKMILLDQLVGEFSLNSNGRSIKQAKFVSCDADSDAEDINGTRDEC